MKKIFIALLTILMLLPLCLSVNAIDDDYADPAIDLPDADASLHSHEFGSYDPLLNSVIETEGVYVEDPLDAPQNDNNVSTFALKETDEDTDITFELEALTRTQFEDDEDGIRFKNIVNVPTNVNEPTKPTKNRSCLYNLVATEFAYYPLKNIDEEFYLNMQGSCNDGEYVYYSFFVGDKYTPAGASEAVKDPVGLCILAGKFDESNTFVTQKITFSTELVGADGLSLANDLKHGNDIAYNSIRDELIVVCCQKGYHNRIYKFPAAYFRDETKTVPAATQINLSCMISSLTYNERLNKYVGGVVGDIDQFVFFDSDFNIIAISDGEDGEKNEDGEPFSGLGRHGICSDDNYIYAVYYVSNTADAMIGDNPVTTCNAIGIFTWDGTLVKEINLKINKFEINENSSYYNYYEIEGMTIIDGKVLLGFNCYNKKSSDSNRVAYFYQYDLSNEFFSIKYCPDDINVTAHINNDDLITQSVLHGYTTKTYTNTFVNSGKHFLGWYLYLVNSGKWRCYNEETGVYKWLDEGQITNGFEKYMYPEHANVTQTASKGNQVLFCAAWEDAENKFYVSFDSNGGKSGTMQQNKPMEYGGSNQLPANCYGKTLNVLYDKIKNQEVTGNVELTFIGWNAYYEEGNKWYYKNSDGSHKVWCIEGEQPKGYVKCVYYDKATISKTAAPGRHIKMFALWNEYTVYYDSNGLLIRKDHILTPSLMPYIEESTAKSALINLYTKDSVSSYTRDYLNQAMPVSLEGYYQHRTEKNLWRYVDNEGDAFWSSLLNNAELYCFTGTKVRKTAGYGEHVVFKAKWNY